MPGPDASPADADHGASTPAETPPPKPRLRGVSHQWGAIVLGPTFWIVALASPPGIRPAMVVYAAGVTAMLSVSACYHRLPLSPRARRVMQRVDHSTIYLCIAASYTPIAFAVLPPITRAIVLAVVWAGTLLGITLQWLPGRPLSWLRSALYILIGWAAVLAAPSLIRNVHLTTFALVLAGGLAFTAGAVVFLTKRPDPWPRSFGYHEVFHVFVLAGVTLQFAGVLTLLPSV
jgi:hemolysin III